MKTTKLGSRLLACVCVILMLLMMLPVSGFSKAENVDEAADESPVYAQEAAPEVVAETTVPESAAEPEPAEEETAESEVPEPETEAAEAVVSIAAATALADEAPLTLDGAGEGITISVNPADGLNTVEDRMVEAKEDGTYDDVVITLTAQTHFTIASVSVSADDSTVLTVGTDYDYESASGKLTINGSALANVTGKVVVTVTLDEDAHVAVTLSGTNVTIEGAEKVYTPAAADYVANLAAAANYVLPDETDTDSIVVKVGDATLELGDIYNKTDGTITIEKDQITGDISISVTGRPASYALTWNVGSKLSGSTTGGVTYLTNFSGTLSVNDEAYALPGSIMVTVGGNEISDYSYDSTTGIIGIGGKNLTGDVVITASAALDAAERFQISDETPEANNDGWYGQTVTIVPAAIATSLSLDGDTWSGTLTVGGATSNLPDGDYTGTSAIKIYVKDENSVAGKAAELAIKVDTLPPTVAHSNADESLVTVSDKHWVKVGKGLTFTFTDTSGIASATVSVNGAETTFTANEYTVPYADLQEGENTIAFTATDNAGHEMEATSFIFYADMTAPASGDTDNGYVTVDEKNWVKDGNSVKFTVSDSSGEGASGVASATISLNGTESEIDIADLTHTYTYDELADGANTIVIKAEDNVGNPLEKPYVIYVDRTAPTLKGVYVTEITYPRTYGVYFNKSLVLTTVWTEEGSGLSVVKLDYAGKTYAADADHLGFDTATIEIPGDVEDIQNILASISLSAEDRVGNPVSVPAENITAIVVNDNTEADNEFILDLLAPAEKDMNITLNYVDHYGPAGEEPMAAWFGNQNVSITISAADRSDTDIPVDPSGIAQIVVTLNGGEILNKTYEAEKKIDISETLSLTADNGVQEGENVVTLTVYDNAGNASPTISKTFHVALGTPSVAHSNADSSLVAGTRWVKKDSALEFTVTDADDEDTSDDAGIKEATLSLNGGEADTFVNNQYTVKYEDLVEGENTIVINAEDNVGHAMEPETLTFYVDKTAPSSEHSNAESSLVTVGENDWILMDKDIEFTVTDTDDDIGNSGVASATITIENEDGEESESEIDLEALSYTYLYKDLSEGKNVVTIQAADLVGNVMTPAVYTVYVDKTPPTNLSISYSEPSIIDKLLSTITFGIWSKPVEVTLSAEDPLSNVVAFFTVSADGAVTTETENAAILKTVDAVLDAETGKYTYTFEIKPEYKGRLSFTATDIVGNTSTSAGGVENNSQNGNVILDTEAPEITFNTPDFTTVHSEDYTLSMTVTDPENSGAYSGLKSVDYMIGVCDSGEFVETGYAGNLYSYASGDYIRQDTYQVKIPASLHSNLVSVKITAVDNAENNAQPAYTHELGEDCYFKMDAVAPVISVTYDNDDALNGKYFKNDRIATIRVEDNNFTADGMTITTGGVKADEWTVVRAYNATGQGEPAIYEYTVTYSANADYKLSITGKDQGNNSTSDSEVTYTGVATQEFTVDHDAPVNLAINYEPLSGFERMLAAIQYGIWSSDIVRVTVSATDSPAGVDYFTIGADSVSTATGANTGFLGSHSATDKGSYNYEYSFAIDAQYKGQLSATATDMAGNTSAQIGGGSDASNDAGGNVLLDTVAPVIVFNGPDYNTVHSSTYTLSLTVTDPETSGVYSGLNSVTYTINQYRTSAQNEYDTLSSGTLFSRTESSNSYQQVFDGTVDISAGINSNLVFVEIIAVDNAGNESSHTRTECFKMDNTAPAISVRYDNDSAENSKYFKATRTATITVMDYNFSAGNTTITTGGSVTSWTTGTDSDGDGLADTYTCTAGYLTDNDYTISITSTDLGRNSTADSQVSYTGTATQDFTIDLTTPTYEIAFADGDTEVEDGGYSQGTVTVTLTVTEHNFDESSATAGITVTRDGVDISSEIRGFISWSSSGDTHTATFEIEEDGEYTVDMSFVDLAGNNTAEGGIKSVFVDQHDPIVTITGVANESANAEREIFPIVTISDKYYDAETGLESITLYNGLGEDVTSKYLNASGASEVVVDEEEDTQSQTFTFSNITEDDIYRLVVVHTDLSGRQNSVMTVLNARGAEEEFSLENDTKMRFSVNRNGSTYTANDSTLAILNDYVQSATDVRIIETNVDELEPESIHIGLTHDSTNRDLVNGTDFTYQVPPAENESGWHIYEYVLSDSLFEEDGVYTITVYSEDAAGNISQNNTEAKDFEVMFIVDKTAPIYVALNLAAGEIYNEEEMTVTINASDNIALDEVHVYKIDSTASKNSDGGYDWSGATELTVTPVGDNGDYSFVLYEGDSAATSKQSVRIVCTDKAGNENADQEILDFTVSSSFWIRYYANKPLFYGSIGGVVVVLGGAAVVFFRKKEEPAEVK